MPPPLAKMAYDRSFAPVHGEAVQIAEGLVRVTAPNVSPYTFTGTNSFLLGGSRLLVIDPGPAEPSHLEALVAAIAGRTVEAIVLTHTHRDHSDLTETLRRRLGGVPVWSGGPHRLSRPKRPFEANPTGGESDWAHRPERVLRDGDVLEIDGLRLSSIATPGHSANHLAFGLAETGILLSGDHVMGWNSTLVSVPEGSMGDYLASLDKLLDGPWRTFHPAHGGPIIDGAEYARALKDHRESRNRQIVEAVSAGATSLAQLRRRIYPDLSGALARAAEMTLRAHVEYLADSGRIGLAQNWSGPRLSPV